MWDVATMSHTRKFKEAILEAQAEASLGGHDIGSFKPVERITGGYEAKCRLCRSTTWVGDNGLRLREGEVMRQALTTNWVRF